MSLRLKTPSKGTSKLRSAASVLYWGYKAFQLLRVCVGEPTVLIEFAAELMLKGIINRESVSLDTMVKAIRNVISPHKGIKGFGVPVTNFSRFFRALSNQLALCGDKDDSATLATADQIYNTFMECDRDGSGAVSLEEFVVFCSKEGVSASDAEEMFFRADIDGNGEVSFEEWTAMMKGRVGRDPKSFDCGGHHGLTAYTASCNGIFCDFCKDPILAGSPASGCRPCNCDACAKCSGFVPPPLPPAKLSPGSLNCGRGHGLELFSVNSWMKCDWCRRGVGAGDVAAGCRACNCDACIECITADLASNSASLLTCPGRHGLALTRTAVPGYVCDFCNADVATDVPIFSCRSCQVDACPPCMWINHNKVLKSGGAFACNGNHALQTIHIMHYWQLQSQKCSYCRGSPTLGERMLWCDICSVSVCNACLASNPARGGPSRRAPPPSYHESLSPRADDAFPPPPPPRPEGGAKRRPPPRYDEFQEHVACPEPHTPAPAAVKPPFRLDAVVRVVGAPEDDVEGKLMTVLGFDPDGKSNGEEECGVVVMQGRGKVYRVPRRYVFTVVD